MEKVESISRWNPLIMLNWGQKKEIGGSKF
jgi:hypothetical protein